MSKPVEIFTFRDISISVFKNIVGSGEKAREVRSFKISKVYTEKDSEEKKYTDNFTADDLLKISLATQELAKADILKKYVVEKNEASK